MALELMFFTGGPREGILRAILAEGHNVKHVYVNDPDRWPKVRASIDIARDCGIPVTIINSKAVLSSIMPQLEGVLCLSAGFNYLFSRDMISVPEAILNVHGTLLPLYRGARTLNWIIENAEKESGITVHLVDEGVDSGPVVLQRSFTLSPFETVASLYRRTLELEPVVVIEALSLFEKHGPACAQPQPILDSPDLPNRIPEHSQIDPSQPLSQLFDRIRACDAQRFPAYFHHKGHKVFVRLERENRPDDEKDMI